MRQLKREQIAVLSKILNANKDELLTLWLADQIYDVINDEKLAKMFGHSYSKIEVICVAEILVWKTMKLPTSLEVLKKAEQKVKSKQQELDF